MSGSISTFDEYFAEYRRLLNEISLEDATAVVDTNSLRRQCAAVLQQMAVEARSVDDLDVKNELLERVKLYKSNLQALERQQDRELLLRGSAAVCSSSSEPWQPNENALMQQNETLERARKRIHETEEIALEITQDLSRNRTTMAQSHQKVRKVSALSARANELVTSMSKWWR